MSEVPERRVTPSAPPQKMPADHTGMLAAGVVLMVLGWLGLYKLVTTEFPRIGGQLWGFFVLLHIAVTGTVLPFVRYLNVRFTPISAPLPPGGVIVRQSVWIGLWVVACTWLQIPRALSWPIAFFLGLVFVVLEIFLRNREMNRDE